MPKKQPKPNPLDPAEVEAMTPEQKLARLKYYDQEIKAAQEDLRDTKKSTNDYIEELRDQQSQILASTVPESREGSVAQARADRQQGGQSTD